MAGNPEDLGEFSLYSKQQPDWCQEHLSQSSEYQERQGATPEGVCAHTPCFLQAAPRQGTHRGGPRMALRTEVPQSWLRYATLMPGESRKACEKGKSSSSPHSPPPPTPLRPLMPRESGERLAGFHTLLPAPTLPSPGRFLGEAEKSSLRPHKMGVGVTKQRSPVSPGPTQPLIRARGQRR